MSADWRREPELNRCGRFCRPLPNRSAITPLFSKKEQLIYSVISQNQLMEENFIHDRTKSPL